MLPSVVANELQESVSAFLRSAFPIATPFFQRDADGGADPLALLNDLIERPGALFKGPYLDIKLPFRRAATDELPFRHVVPEFPPHQHQLEAFRRLCGDAPQSTIVATGTGSGKTECFMLPVIDDCIERREKGIKAIIIYPMNALATDQARRIAQLVARESTKITVGLFVGGEQENAQTTMGPDNVITCQKTLRKHPPDILLTNYKMLDFLLIRPRDQALWRHNQPGTLRYLVVDELHTFDGAQGTDLACLVRRLRDRLESGPELACVGTSATMGTGAGGELRNYAHDIFDADFPDSAIVVEDRLSAREYLASLEQPADEDGHPLQFSQWPDRFEERLDPQRYDRVEDYLAHQVRLWFPGLPADQLPPFNARDEARRGEAGRMLGALLPGLRAFHILIEAAASLVDARVLVEDWRHGIAPGEAEQVRRLLASLVALVSAARQADGRPMLQVRQQLWLRELRRLVCTVPSDGSVASIRFADDEPSKQGPLQLPLVHCRECNLAGWGAVSKHGDPHLLTDLQGFYQAWFGYATQSTLLVPRMDGEDGGDERRAFCTNCQRLQPLGNETSCIECGDEALLPVWTPDMVRVVGREGEQRPMGHHDCPACHARESLAVVGYRAATLISVMTSRLYASPYNDDYKLIAFSDSVQDAAHRAGFLGANTWRQVVRQAMAAWLAEQPSAVSLREMRDSLPVVWRDRSHDDAHFCGTFIAPNMLWRNDYEVLIQDGVLPRNSDLPGLVGKRLAWECVSEFGRRGAVGRSLERTGVAAAGFAVERLVADVEAIAEVLREEIESLREVADAEFVHFVLGWLHHLRREGAIADPSLASYLGGKGREYLLNRLPWMPGFGRSQRPPAAITLQNLAPNFEACVLNKRDTWAVRWLKKTLGAQALFVAAEAMQVFHLLLQGLTKSGWLLETDVQGTSCWMLNPERVLVSTEVGRVACTGCRHPVSLPARSLPTFVGMPCPRPSCSGTLHAVAPPAPEERRAYGVALPRRLVPHEHTGLLARGDRERVESSFINGKEPWDVNLLSATPTLEMGIDIGALSSVMLCSVPPAQANYLQRIGRAGRRDGNAVTVTVANGQSHDLYFYSEPLEMMVGEVATPGVFLEAIAVLERQLIAYCFDRWAASGIDESAIPGVMRKVLDVVEHQHSDRFPYNFFTFIQDHRAGIFERFLALFPALTEEARTYLDNFLRKEGEGGLSYRLVIRLQQLVAERKALSLRIDRLKAQRDRLEQQPRDEARDADIDELEQERGALISLRAALNGQHVLNFFTDEGLLPNYAFPEEGVMLRSVILRRRSDGDRQEGEGRYEKLAYQFQRPAQAALGELAPENRFYAVAHQMQIDQVDLDLSEVEHWRFCDRCHHTDRVDTHDPHSACPQCGSPQWANIGQRHAVLRLRQVYSTVDDRWSRIGDDSEQREPMFFNRQMLVDIPPDGNQGGFRLKSDSLPFGFEFLSTAKLREVNFGVRGGETNVFSVAGKELPRRGFRICRHCGKVQKEKPRPNEQMHGFSCPLRRDPAAAAPDDYLDSLYLYRELFSEAIRVLLPLSEVAYSDQQLHSFVAALNLGLRRYFRGDVHHLEVTTMRDPASAESGERVYLVLYDRIPGGTGYLKELMRDRDNLFEVLALAHERLTRCECVEDEHRDGCYRCILAYRESRNMDTISREAAATLLDEILKQRNNLEAVETLSDISTNVLIESKLEQRFVDALGRLPGAQLTPLMFNGKAGSLLTLPGADGRPVAWRVEHQVKVGPEQQVALQTQIDVLLTPAREEDARRYRPIAVYTDGLQYHHEIVADDVCKRTALLLSRRYRVFTFNWHDLPEPGGLAMSHLGDPMSRPGKEPGATDLYDQMADQYGWRTNAVLASGHARPALDWLADLLRAPEQAEQHLCERAMHRGISALLPGRVSDPGLRDRLGESLVERAPVAVRELMGMVDPAVVPGGIAAVIDEGVRDPELFASLPLAAVRAGGAEGIVAGMRLLLVFDDRDSAITDEFRDRWRAFWHVANQLQFAPGFYMASRRAVSGGLLDQVWDVAAQWAPSPGTQAPVAADTVTQDWPEVVEYSNLPPNQLAAIHALGIPEPGVGIDILDEDNAIVVSGERVELCWQRQRAVVLMDEQPGLPDNWRWLVADDELPARLNGWVSEGVFQ